MLNKNLMMRMVILMTILFTKGIINNCNQANFCNFNVYIEHDIIIVNVESLITNDCAHGDVRLVGNNLRHQGIVEVCINLNWGRVCRDGWGYNDAAVVCKQLNYGSEGKCLNCINYSWTSNIIYPIGAIPTIWIGRSTVPIFLDNVDCQSSEATLLNCSHFKRFDRGYNCRNGGYAGVKCSEEQLRVQDVSIAIDNATTPTIVISWELYGGTRHKPSSFRVECFNRLRKEFSLWVNNGTITHLAYRVSVGDTLSSTFSACCVSAIHYGYYETRRRCTSTEILPPDLFTTSTPSQALNQSFTTLISTQTNPSLITPSIGSEKSASGGLISMRASIVSIGGVLGSIIVVLLLLLAVCGGALLFLLRSRNTIPKA